MLELSNRTAYPAAIVPGLDRDGREFATVAVKASFKLADQRGQGTLPVAEEQTPLVWADEFYGEPDSSSIKYESETGPAKGGTDIALVGRAYAPEGRKAKQVDVRVGVGKISKTVRVLGERRWIRTLGTTQKTAPLAFVTMPLVYERAFGGADVSHPKDSQHGMEERNPVGVGYTTAGRGDHFDDLAVANLEDPKALITRLKDKPPPAGFGFIGRHWQPRRSYVGTYDDAWQQTRCPLLPADFDPRYFRSAHPDLCAPGHFQGGEPAHVLNASPSGMIGFALPGLRFEIKVAVKGEVKFLESQVDTVLIEPDEQRVSMTWKATLECPRSFLLIEYIRVRELERLA